MLLKLHMTEMSPPSRGTMLTAAAMDLQLEFININFLKKEHLQPEFIAKNPQHTVPTLEDGEFILWDSHAISIYLVTQYASDDSLYPQDPKVRAVVHQRLFFDAEVFLIMKKAVLPLWANTANSFSPHTIKEIEDSYGFMEIFLTKNKWCACNQLTIADFSLIATISTVHEMLPIDRYKFPRLWDWVKRLEQFPFYEEMNARGARALGEIVRSKLN